MRRLGTSVSGRRTTEGMEANGHDVRTASSHGGCRRAPVHGACPQLPVAYSVRHDPQFHERDRYQAPRPTPRKATDVTQNTSRATAPRPSGFDPGGLSGFSTAFPLVREEPPKCTQSTSTDTPTPTPTSTSTSSSPNSSSRSPFAPHGHAAPTAMAP